MPKIHVILKNKDILSKIKKIENNFKRGIKNAFKDISYTVSTEAKRLITEPPKTGRIYRIKKKNGKSFSHQASSPGQSPANLYGNLRKSIKYKAGGTSNKFILSAGNDKVNYASRLELGDASRKLHPRPYLKKAIDIKSSYIIQRFYDLINAEFSKK